MDKDGYQAPLLDDVHQRALRIIKGTASFEDRYNPDHEKAVKLIENLRSMGCVIVFTTGVWDLFHIGHAEYIHRGKQEAVNLFPSADHVIMVVGIDTDEMTRRRKGPDRPIVPEDERLHVLSHLRSVDILVPQYEPDQLYKLISHDVRVISESTRDLPGLEKIRKQCKHLVNLPPQSETSTTARIRKLTLDGGSAVLFTVEKKLERLLQEVRDGLDKS
jgi:D-beta-D-heptose 7-phosphate kinase/D-beta-D-heptose 1-phosphate adenosyltransferase